MVSGDFFVETVVGTVEMSISTLSLVANTASFSADWETNSECRIGTDRSILWFASTALRLSTIGGATPNRSWRRTLAAWMRNSSVSRADSPKPVPSATWNVINKGDALVE